MKYSQTKKKPLFFRFIRFSIGCFYKKREIVGLENLPKEPCVIISNHAQIHGPLACEMFFPSPKYVWCIGSVMKIKEFPSYAYQDFWSNKPKCIRWFFKLIAYLGAPIASYIFTRADTIAVYKDSRIISTYKNTVKALKDGANVIIFPESSDKFNDVVNEFQDKFVDVARLYYKATGKNLQFVPMYNAAKLKKLVLGKPIEFNPEKETDTHRKEICDYLKTSITDLALSLPPHVIVPYDNVGRKNYKRSK